MPDLVISTPEGVPNAVLELWDRHLFNTANAGSVAIRPVPQSLQVKDLHEKILRDHQKSWFQLARYGYQLFDDADYTQTAREIAREFTDDSPRVLVDPLLCFFAPLWYRELDDPICIFFYGEPLECAVRLQDRWRFPLHFGLALWEYYVVSALSHLRQQKYLLFSLARFRKSPDAYMTEIRKCYRELKGFSSQQKYDFESALDRDWSDPVATPDPRRHLTQPQTLLFDALEAGSVDDIPGLALSEQSEDILFHYGNLRAGYDQIRDTRDKLQRKLQSRGQARDSYETHRNDYKLDVSDQNVEVVVHIDGMSPLTFLSEPDSPLIELLETTLQNQSQNPGELVYLECAGSEMSSFYFRAGDLLAVETGHSIT